MVKMSKDIEKKLMDFVKKQALHRRISIIRLGDALSCSRKDAIAIMEKCPEIFMQVPVWRVRRIRGKKYKKSKLIST